MYYFHRDIKQLREAADVTQKELARRAGITASTLGNAERVRKVTPRTAKKICAAVNTLAGTNYSLEDLAHVPRKSFDGIPNPKRDMGHKATCRCEICKTASLVHKAPGRFSKKELDEKHELLVRLKRL